MKDENNKKYSEILSDPAIPHLGKVYLTVGSRSLIWVDSHWYISTSPEYYEGQEVAVDVRTLIKVPSLLYGCASLVDDTDKEVSADKIEKIVNAVKSTWDLK